MKTALAGREGGQEEVRRIFLRKFSLCCTQWVQSILEVAVEFAILLGNMAVNFLDIHYHRGFLEH